MSKRQTWFSLGAAALGLAALAVSLTALLATPDSEHAELHDAFTVMMTRLAVERYEAWGREELVRYYNTPDSGNGDWYVFIVDEDATALAAYPWAGELGYDVRETWISPNGDRVGEAVMTADEDGMWPEYVQRQNPATGKPAEKRTWVIKRDGLIFGSGWYPP